MAIKSGRRPSRSYRTPSFSPLPIEWLAWLLGRPKTYNRLPVARHNHAAMTLRAAACSLIVLGFMPSIAVGQALSPATSLRLQVGGSVSGSISNVAPQFNLGEVRGYGLFSDYSLFSHLGMEAEFHRQTNSNTTAVQTSYDVGPRYQFAMRRFTPYAKAMMGVGVLNTSTFKSVLPSCMAAFGGGIDAQMVGHFYMRTDFELQRWLNAVNGVPGGLTSQLVTVGVSYKFDRRGPMRPY